MRMIAHTNAIQGNPKRTYSTQNISSPMALYETCPKHTKHRTEIKKPTPKNITSAIIM